jgi:heterodisulfide reductase subunit A
MDMRTFGKDYEHYLARSRDDYGVRFIRCRPHSVVRKSSDQDLTIAYVPEDEAGMTEEAFDMVVLSTGFQISEAVREQARQLDITLNDHGFARTTSFDPVATSRPGVYVCGMFEGPKDIPETMAQAGAAACRAGMHIAALEEEIGEDEDLLPETNVSDEAPIIGVFICDCGENIGGVVDVQELAAFSATLPNVFVSEVVGHGCSRAAMEHIEDVIRNKKINRVVIGGCSPRTHELRFQETIRRAGLNKYLLEIANLRDQNTWVHLNEPKKADDKARQLIRGAVFAVAKARPLQDHRLPIDRNVLVVGGGIAGMTAALRMADQGHKVFLAERMSMLGGVAALVQRTIDGEDVQAFIQALIQRTQEHDNIQVITNAVIVDHSGMPGKFTTGIQAGPQMFYRQINHGATILATGALPNRPRQYLLDQHPAVMTQLDADGILENQPKNVAGWDNVVMIQCVGSRVAENPNCSRICCQAAVKNALRILEIKPDARIFILYRDMRTYGFLEDAYLKAREAGVIFVRYTTDTPRYATGGGSRQ